MQEITHVYIDGRFVEPHGTELFDRHNPPTGEVFGRVRLGDVRDARAAIAAAKRAFPAWSRSTKADRISLLHRLHEAMEASCRVPCRFQMDLVEPRVYRVPRGHAGSRGPTVC